MACRLARGLDIPLCQATRKSMMAVPLRGIKVPRSSKRDGPSRLDTQGWRHRDPTYHKRDEKYHLLDEGLVGPNGIPYMGQGDSPVRDYQNLKQTGIAYMNGIRNFNKECVPTAYKLSKPLTVAEAKAQGFNFSRPMREYYDPPHWKFGRTHLMMSLEFDNLHAWVQPPEGKPFPPCPLSTLTEDEQNEKWPFFVPTLQKMAVYEDDWIITDLHTMWQDTPVWAAPAFERFLGVKLHAADSPEYESLVTDADSAELAETEGDGWVGSKYFRAQEQRLYGGQLDLDDIAREDPDAAEDDPKEYNEKLIQELDEDLKK